jgi:hypothetical protein
MFTGAAITVVLISITNLRTGIIIVVAFGLGLTVLNVLMCVTHLVCPTAPMTATTRDDDNSQDYPIA